MEAVSFEVAESEVKRWLDEKKVSSRRRDAMIGMQENIIEAIQDGLITIDDECVITQKLKFPDGVGANELRWKTRISSIDLEGPKRVVKGDAWDDNMTRTIMAATGCVANTARKLDSTTDRQLAESIAIFF